MVYRFLAAAIQGSMETILSIIRHYTAQCTIVYDEVKVKLWQELKCGDVTVNSI